MAELLLANYTGCHHKLFFLIYSIENWRLHEKKKQNFNLKPVERRGVTSMSINMHCLLNGNFHKFIDIIGDLQFQLNQRPACRSIQSNRIRYFLIVQRTFNF